LALGVIHGLPIKHANIAKKLAYTCNEMHKNAMGLSPEIVYFNIDNNDSPDYYIKVYYYYSNIQKHSFGHHNYS
jgi:hypothetical protein